MTALSNLSPAAVEQIARRVVELLRENDHGRPRRYVDAATLAAELGVERDWVYAHADELGALRLGGPNGRLRFDLPAIVEELANEPRSTRRAPLRSARTIQRQRPKNRPRRRVESPQEQRRASDSAPARSPKQHQTGGNPDDAA